MLYIGCKHQFMRQPFNAEPDLKVLPIEKIPLPLNSRDEAAPNSPLLLPALPLVGDYELDDIALVDAATGKTRMEATPSTVPVHVFDQVLISSVTSQPLTLDQIQQKGIDIDADNLTPIPNARVYIGHYNLNTVNNVVAIVSADSSGAWEAANVPIATWDVPARAYKFTSASGPITR